MGSYDDDSPHMTQPGRAAAIPPDRDAPLSASPTHSPVVARTAWRHASPSSSTHWETGCQPSGADVWGTTLTVRSSNHENKSTAPVGELERCGSPRRTAKPSSA